MGLVIITIFKVLFSPLAEGAGPAGLAAHLGNEWVIALLLGVPLRKPA